MLKILKFSGSSYMSSFLDEDYMDEEDDNNNQEDQFKI